MNCLLPEARQSRSCIVGGNNESGKSRRNLLRTVATSCSVYTFRVICVAHASRLNASNSFTTALLDPLRR